MVLKFNLAQIGETMGEAETCVKVLGNFTLAPTYERPKSKAHTQ